MANYTPDNVLNREKSGEVFAQVCLRETYASEITENTGIDRSMVSEILSSLKKKGFIKVSRRSQAKYYVLDQEGVAEYSISKFIEVYSEEIFEENIDVNFDTPLDRKKLNKEMADFMKRYLNAKFTIENHAVRPQHAVGVDELTNFFIYALIQSTIKLNDVTSMYGVPKEVKKLMLTCLNEEANTIKKYKEHM